MSSSMNDLVIDTIREVMAENQRSVTDLKPETQILAGTSLDSLDLAIVVVKMEIKTGKDPFKQGFIFFSTVQELAKLYE